MNEGIVSIFFIISVYWSTGFVGLDCYLEGSPHEWVKLTVTPIVNESPRETIVVHRFYRVGLPPRRLYIINSLSCQPTHYPWTPSGGWSCPTPRNSVPFRYLEAGPVESARR